ALRASCGCCTRPTRSGSSSRLQGGRPPQAGTGCSISCPLRFTTGCRSCWDRRATWTISSSLCAANGRLKFLAPPVRTGRVGLLQPVMPPPARRIESPPTSFAGLSCEETRALRLVVRAVIASVLGESKDHPDVEDCTHEVLSRAIEGRSR